MGKRVVDDASLKAVADRIRGWTGLPEELEFPAGFVSGVDAAVSEGSIPAYNQGHMDGYDDGYSVGHLNGKIEGYDEGKADGIAEGKQAEYDRFWDGYQNYGRATFLGSAFAGRGWNANTFYPKYNIVSDRYALSSVFAYFGYTEKTPFNLEARLLELGITMDFSKGSSPSNMFSSANIDVIPELDFSAHTSIAYLFNGANKTITIRKVKVSETVKNYNQSFNGCTALEYIRFEGTIVGAIDFQWSTKLTKASIESIMAALSPTTSGLSVTFSATAVSNAFTDTEWATLANTRPNWTINLV